jgi:tRNA pseudouridine13 synthase
MRSVFFTEPEDFRVDEIPLYAPLGEGGHTFLRVEKRNRTTEDVARFLARAAGVSARDVGYAGRKDGFAVATQWFSVPGLDPSAALELELPDVRVLEASAHPHKLRTGQLRANRFDLFARGVSPEAQREAERRLEQIVGRGLANRFGVQRFGRERGNAEAGRALLGGAARPRDRRQARFLLSAFQAELFNAVLAEREPRLEELEPGDLAVVHASGGLFCVEDLAREAPRARSFEISATGPIFGTRMPQPGGAVAAREARILAAHGLAAEDIRPPRGVRLRGARRALRVKPGGASVERSARGLRLRCTLPAGSYASVLVHELLGPGGGDTAPPCGVS